MQEAKCKQERKRVRGINEQARRGRKSEEGKARENNRGKSMR